MTAEALAAITAFVAQMSGTPYIAGGNSPAGTDCSGAASFVANIAVGREPFSGRFHTGTEGPALAERGFVPGTAPDALVIGWNSRHTAISLPDGTAIASGEAGGIRFGGGGAFQPQFTRHAHLVLQPDVPPEPLPPEPDAEQP